MPDSWVEFPPFRLDLVNHELWRDSERVPLRPKPFAVLAYLATHPQRLVLRDELVRAVWPDTHVGAGLLRGYVRDLRAALHDDAESPRFIQTVAHRGYRFIAEIRRHVEQVRSTAVAEAQAEPQRSQFVGRDAELADLERRFSAALGGVRQVLFVTGEPGIGKTTLVDRFLSRIAGTDVWTARGQCVEHFGPSEPYLPLLEALGQLGRTAQARQVKDVLARHAPTWLVQMPSLTDDRELEALQRKVQGATRERMLRELAEAFEVLTTIRPLLLVVEDLHWCDPSTLDLLSSLARRRERARLLFVGTYRPSDVLASGHPLAAMKRELQSHGQCETLALEALSVTEIAEYLAKRFPRQRLPADFVTAVHRATEGNPLFVVNVVDYWIERAVLIKDRDHWTVDTRAADLESAVPDTLRQMIEKQLDALSSEARAVLEVASVVGREFSSAPVSAALRESEASVDELCEGLAARKQFISVKGVDVAASGTVVGRYEFVHGLYPQVLYARLAAPRRTRLHRCIGEWEEAASGAHAPDHAATLAVHFERGHDFERAVRHLRAAAANAMRKHAYTEAVTLLERAIDLFDRLPDGARHAADELSLRMAIAAPLLMTKGYAAPEVERAYARAYELSREMEESPALVFSLTGLFRFFFGRAKFGPAAELAAHVLRLAETHDPSLLSVAHGIVALPLLSVGDLAAAREHLEKAIALYDFERHRSIAAHQGDEPGLVALAFLAITLWYLGYPDRALQRARESHALAEKLEAPYGIAFAHAFCAWVHVRRGEPREALAYCDALLRIAAEQDLAFFLAEGTVLRGWASAKKGDASGLEQMRRGLEWYRRGGADMGRPSHLALLAGAYAEANRCEEGLEVLDEAFAAVAEMGGCTDEAELYRLRAELLNAKAKAARSRDAAEDETRRSVGHALEIARRMGTRSLELRAAMSLVRVSRTRRDQAQARSALQDLFDSFTEGLETADLLAARRMLRAPARLKVS